MSDEKHVCVQNVYPPYENVAGSISGFDSITTSKTGVPVGTHPAPIISPADITNILRELRATIDGPAMKAAVQALEQHIADTDNPHHLDLNDFSQNVVDVLYKAYVENGGDASLAQFQDHVFGKLRVATYDEMIHVEDDNLLVNIAGARRYFERHENDPQAHAALIKAQYPGKPVFEEPTIAIDPELGLPPLLLAMSNEDTVPYTYVDGDGVLRTCDRAAELPVDWCDGYAALPCFGRKTNDILWSEDLAQSTIAINTTLNRNNHPSPDGLLAATEVRSAIDASEVLHKVVFREQRYNNKERTFSIYAKANKCRYLSIQFKDMVVDTTYVRAQFDLEQGNKLIFNHLDTYRCNISKLTDGWWRCEVSLFHEVGNITDIELVFHKAITGLSDAKLTFRAEDEPLGYIFGAQMEYGHRASPYIRTAGAPVTRNPPIVMFDIRDQVATNYTISVACKNPKLTNSRADSLPLYSIIGEHEITINHAYLLATGAILCSQYEIISNEDNSFHTATKLCTLTFASTNNTAISFACSVGNTVKAVCNDIDLELDLRKAEKAVYLALGYADGEFLDDYIYSTLLYSKTMEKDELVFINGDKYLEYR